MIVPELLILFAVIGVALVFLMLLNIKLGLFIFFVTLPFQSIFFYFKFMYMALSDIFAALIFLSWLILLLLRRVEFPRKRALYFIGILWALILVGCLTSIDQRTSLRFAFRLLSFFAVFIVLLSVMQNMRIVRLILYAMAVQLLLISVVTNWKYMKSGVQIQDLSDVDEESEHTRVRQSGIAGCMNETAFNITMLMPLTLGLALSEKRKKLFVVIAVALAALVITMSRSGWVACMASVFFLPKLRLKHLLFFAVVFVLVFSIFYNIFIGRIEASTLKSTSIRTRLLMWDYSFYLTKKRPFLGIGAGNFAENAYREFPELVYRLPVGINHCSTHNQYLGILVENGIIALIVYVLFLVHTAKRVLYNKTFAGEKMNILRRSVLASFVALVIFQMFAQYGLRNYLAWSILALAYCLHDIAAREYEKEKVVSAHVSLEVVDAEFAEGEKWESLSFQDGQEETRIVDDEQEHQKDG